MSGNNYLFEIFTYNNVRYNNLDYRILLMMVNN